MANLSYDEAYSKLKAWGWDDARIVKALNANGLYKDSKDWGWGGWTDEVDLWWPNNDSPINDIEVPEKYTNVDIDYTDPKGEEKLWEIGDTATPDKNDDSDESLTSWRGPKDAATIAMIIQECIKNWVTVNWLGKWLSWAWSTFLKWIWATWKFLARNAWAIATWLASAYETEQDRKKWVLKAEYWVDWDYSAWAYARDFWRNMYWYTDNVLFWALPNIDAVYNKADDDWLYTNVHSNEAQKHQKEELKKNKEIVDDYKKLWWNRFDNLLWTDWFEWWYLEEEKNIKKKYWADWVSMADQQLTRAAVDLWLMNDADFKKQIIDDWYKFWTVKDKNWNTTKTWYKESTWSDGKKKYTTLTNEVKYIRAKAKQNSWNK